MNLLMMQQDKLNDIEQVLVTRNIHFNKAFTREYCYEIIDLLNKVREYDELVNTPKDELYIRITICSEGGSTFALCTILETIEKLKSEGYEIHTHVNVLCASCGFILFAGGTYRTVGQFSSLLNHQASFMARGTIREIEVESELNKATEKMFNDYLRANTDMTEEEIMKPYVTNTDIWYNAQEAVDKGIAHKIENL